MAWDPAIYLRFGDQRTRPASDLLARVAELSPGRVLDLGCGPGNSTLLLRERWPSAKIVGLDRSREMLAKAAMTELLVDWVEDSIEGFLPDVPFDVVFSNAAIHWVADHPTLVPRLLRDLVNKGGTIAVQIPYRSTGQPFVTLLHEVLRLGRWADRFQDMEWGKPGLGPEKYFDVLAQSGATDIDVWLSEYLHALDGEDAVLHWTEGTLLLPFLERLNAEERPAFCDEYRERLRAAYPRRADGLTLLPFSRLFFVARRQG